MSENQDLAGLETADDTVDLSAVPEPVDSMATDPMPFDDVSSASDWNAPVDDAVPAFEPASEPPMPDDFGAAVPPSGDTTPPPPGAPDPNAAVTPPPLPEVGIDGLPPALPDDTGTDTAVATDVSLPLDDGPLMPGDIGAAVPPSGDTTTPPPGAPDPNAAVTPPPLPGAGIDGLPPALPDDTSTGTPSVTGDAVMPPPPPGTEVRLPSNEVHVVDGALVDEHGQAVDAARAGLWHDGSTVYDASGDVVWTGNSPIAAPIEVPDSIADFMATTAATEVPETLPPALPTVPYTAVPEDDALRIVQELVGPATGDTYGTLLDQLGALSSDGSMSPDEFGAFLVDHASELGALTIPAGATSGDPAALGELAAQFGSAEAAWTRELAAAVLSADGDSVPGTQIHLTDDGQLAAVPPGSNDGGLVAPPPPGGVTVAPHSDEFKIAGGQLTDLQGNTVTPEAAGLRYAANGDVVDRDGEVVWTRNNPVGAPNELPAEISQYLATQGEGPIDGRPDPTAPVGPIDGRPDPTAPVGPIDGRPDPTAPVPTTGGPDLTAPGSSTDPDGSSRFAIYEQGEGRDHIVDEKTGQDLTPEQAGLRLVNGEVLDRDNNVVWTPNNPVGAPNPVPESLKAWIASQQDGTPTTTLPPALPAQQGDSMQQILARQEAMHREIQALAANGSITVDEKLMAAHEQWIAETHVMLAEHEDSMVARIGVMMEDQPVRILTSVDGGTPTPVTVTRIETDRVIGERPDGAIVAIDTATLESAVKAAADKSDGGGNGLLLLGIGGAIVVPAVVAGGIVAARKMRARSAVAGY